MLRRGLISIAVLAALAPAGCGESKDSSTERSSSTPNGTETTTRSGSSANESGGVGKQSAGQQSAGQTHGDVKKSQSQDRKPEAQTAKGKTDAVIETENCAKEAGSDPAKLRKCFPEIAAQQAAAAQEANKCLKKSSDEEKVKCQMDLANKQVKKAAILASQIASKQSGSKPAKCVAEAQGDFAKIQRCVRQYAPRGSVLAKRSKAQKCMDEALGDLPKMQECLNRYAPRGLSLAKRPEARKCVEKAIGNPEALLKCTKDHPASPR